MRALLAALLLARAAAASDCSTPLAFQPIPDLHVHVGFPVNYTARLNRYCSTWSFRKVTAPPEFDLDGAGGLFYVEHSATGAAWSYETVAMLAPDSTSWAVTGGGYYRVRAARAGVPSRPSNAVSVP